MFTSAHESPSMVELWWNDQDICRTRLFDAISLVLPVGEQFVMDAVSAWLQMQSNNGSLTSHLQQDAQRFVCEELSHQRAHRAYNNKLAEHLPVAHIEQRLIQAMQAMAAWPLRKRIALAAALEHLTALFSTEILRNNNAWLSRQYSHQTQMWRWHCAEEINHHHICMEILKSCKVSAGERLLAIVGAAMYLVVDILSLWLQICRNDLQAHRVSMRVLMLHSLRFVPRMLPGLLRMLFGCSQFMRIRSK
jgi:uncharacterized protein